MFVADLSAAVKTLYEKSAKRRKAALRAENRLKRLLLDFLVDDPDAFRNIRGSLPQKAIAIAAGVPQPYVSYIESGQYDKIELDKLVKLLNAYASKESAR